MTATKRRPNMTPEQLDRMAVLWAEGASAKRIAQEVGVTRSQVLNASCRHRGRFPYRHERRRMDA